MTHSMAPAAPDSHRREVDAGERFQFGENWRAFLEVLTEERIEIAVASLRQMLGVETLAGQTFLDIGSGSGLFSLAAYRLGATVTSFDYDPSSVGCTTELRRRYAPDSERWSVGRGSVLDDRFMADLGQFDVVYSWGVLHHTGDMWGAIDRACARVREGGTLFIAIYNDQGAWSRRWQRIKRLYCSGLVGRIGVTAAFFSWWTFRDLMADLVWLRNPLARYREYKRSRGMSVVHDWRDWLGGYPFEYAKPEGIILPLLTRGFELHNLVTAFGSVGCVEYVFRRSPSQ